MAGREPNSESMGVSSGVDLSRGSAPAVLPPLLVLLPTPVAERLFHEHSFILRARLTEIPCLNRPGASRWLALPSPRQIFPSDQNVCHTWARFPPICVICSLNVARPKKRETSQRNSTWKDRFSFKKSVEQIKQPDQQPAALDQQPAASHQQPAASDQQ